jgi:hypothetical protein
MTAWYKEIWTYMIVTALTVLIWFWAAGEKRETKRIDAARIHFGVPEQEQWIVTPGQVSVVLVAEGSKLAIQKAEALFRRPLNITVAASAGKQSVDLLETLRQNDAMRMTGAAIRSVEPASIELDLDSVERVAARVVPVLPGIQLEGDIAIEPPEVTVQMPGRMRARLPQSVTVEAFVDRAELDRLPPAVRQTRDAKLRLPENLQAVTASDVSITPSRATLTFTVRSRTREVKLDAVRVQLAGPPEDRDAFVVDVDPKQFRDVTVSADADLVRRIETGEVNVVAIVHLSSRDKEARLESKKVTAFMALVPEPGGATRGVQVQVKVGESSDMPLVKLKITDRAAP